MKIEFQNLSGCENAYSFINLMGDTSPPIPLKKIPELARKLSSQEGTDGMILMVPPQHPDKTDCGMRIFNKDGSEAQMCGNGIRGLAKFYERFFGPKDSLKVETVAGLRECFVLDRSDPEKFKVKVNMGRPTFIPAKIPVLFDDVIVMNEEFEVDDKTFMVSCANLGNPHCVIEIKDLESFDVARYGPQIEKHEAFPEGVNVEFIENKNGEIFQRTWERGSGETKACGTGACAAAITSIMRNRTESPVEVHLRGGTLIIEWDGLREVWMTGDAVSGVEATIEL